MENKPKLSKVAIASLVLGILSLFFLGTFKFQLSFFTGMLAIIFGVIAKVDIKKSGGSLKGKGFSIAGIVLSVASVMVLLVLIVDSMFTPNYPRRIQQKAQFHEISVGLEIFNSEIGTYPESNDNSVNMSSDPQDNFDPTPYCGANKLAEAMAGLDLLGFHPDSRFSSDGMDDSGQAIYIPETSDIRKGPFIELENANVYSLKDIFKDVGDFDGNTLVICDVYEKKRHSGKKTGMPIPILSCQNSFFVPRFRRFKCKYR